MNNNFTWNKELIEQYLHSNHTVKLNKIDRNYRTGFMWVCELYPELVQLMLEENNIDFNIKNRWGKTGFMWACTQHPSTLVLKMLKKDSIDFNTKDKWGRTGFMFACKYNPKIIIPLIESNKINPLFKNNDGLTGWDIAKKHNPESFKIYKAYVENQKLKIKNNTKSKKPKTLL